MAHLNPAKNHPQQVAKRQRTSLFGDVDVTDLVDDRGTPDKFFRELDSEFHFTLDAAAATHNAKCERFFDLASNGLIQSWAGERVWCNPPYSEMPSWVLKAELETAAELVVMLMPANRTEQPFWQVHIEPFRDRGGALEVRFVPGRLTTPEGKMGRAPFGSVLVIWRKPV